MDDSGISDFGNTIPYDLRQIYAVDIVGEHLKDVMEARKKDSYSNYYKCLRDLFIVIRHKIKVKDKEESLETYKNLISAAVDLANRFPETWTGRFKDPEECSLIEESLNEIEMFLYSIIEKANMFGGASRIIGL